ncbi:MAG: PilW family protein, partial [Candidatus Acidiferrales bacterium]
MNYQTRIHKIDDMKGTRLPAAARNGFSLVELLVAMAVFLIVAGAAFALFNQHTALAVRQQNLSGVNIGLRNGLAQLQ